MRQFYINISYRGLDKEMDMKNIVWDSLIKGKVQHLVGENQISFTKKLTKCTYASKHDQLTSKPIDGPFSVEAGHEGDKAAHVPALPLVLRPGPHDLHGGQGAEAAEYPTHLLFGHLKGISN